MKKSFLLLNEDFESSSGRTPQYLNFFKVFKKEFTLLLKELECSKIVFSKPNHFDVTGFFTAKNGQIWYFSIDDLRWDKGNMLVRTAQHYQDWTGGTNNYVHLLEELLKPRLRDLINL